MSELCQVLNIPEVCVYCVPGNHDVDQDVIRESCCLDRSQVAIEDASDLDVEISGFLRDPNSRSMMYSHICEYNRFSAQFNCDINAANPTWKEDVILNDGSILRLHGLNTVIISSHRDKDDRRMVLGRHQIPSNDKGVCHISLCHHPPETWKDSDATKTTLLARTHVQLYGHKHTQSIIRQNNSVILFSGATHPVRAEKQWRPRYNWLSIYVDETNNERSLRITVLPRVLDNDNNRFIADTNNCKGNGSIEYSLELDGREGVTATSLEVEKMPEANNKPASKEDEMAVSIVNPIRTLIYRFFGLSYTARQLILNELGLIYDEDEGIEHTKLFRTLLKRAEEKMVLSKLWDRIENSHGDSKYEINPFNDDNPQIGV